MIDIYNRDYGAQCVVRIANSNDKFILFMCYAFCFFIRPFANGFTGMTWFSYNHCNNPAKLIPISSNTGFSICFTTGNSFPYDIGNSAFGTGLHGQ